MFSSCHCRTLSDHNNAKTPENYARPAKQCGDGIMLAQEIRDQNKVGQAKITP